MAKASTQIRKNNMISRRALLGTLVGFPFGIKVAQGKSPKIGDIKVTAISSLIFNPQRIEDIGDAFFSNLEQHLISRGKSIRYTDKVIVHEDSSWGTAFIIPLMYAEKSIQTMLDLFAMPAITELSRELMERHNFKCRYYGIDIRRHSDGLVFWMAFTNVKKWPCASNAAYSRWTRV